MYHGLVVDSSFDRKPVDYAEEQDDIRDLGKFEPQEDYSILDELQGFYGTIGEPSQQRVAVVQTGENKWIRTCAAPCVRHLARSILLLIPLFGIHYTVFSFSPEDVSKRKRLVFEQCLSSFQGFVVAVLYCFLNGEISPLLKQPLLLV